MLRLSNILTCQLPLFLPSTLPVLLPQARSVHLLISRDHLMRCFLISSDCRERNVSMPGASRGHLRFSPAAFWSPRVPQQSQPDLPLKKELFRGLYSSLCYSTLPVTTGIFSMYLLNSIGATPGHEGNRQGLTSIWRCSTEDTQQLYVLHSFSHRLHHFLFSFAKSLVKPEMSSFDSVWHFILLFLLYALLDPHVKGLRGWSWHIPSLS